MTESAKTLTFVAAGILALGAAYVAEPGDQTDNLQELVGQSLNANVDPSAPRRLRVVKFDRDTASVRQFEVAEVDGVWSLPSKENYPADATEQMAEAATCVMNRKILRIAGETAQAHEEFGVVDPLSEKLTSKSTGVGTRVIMTDADDQKLVDLIIGKSVKDGPGQRFVRNSSQDVVYVVELDPTNLSTDFEDWIEEDLLELNAFDLRKAYLNDYSADFSIALTQRGLERRVSWERRAEMALAYDDSNSQWALVELKKPGPGGQQMIPDAMADDEEVNQEALNKLRDGLDDLLIVDVARKPTGLSADLKAGKDFLNNAEAVEDLIEKGFSPVMIDGADEILSSEGELVCTTRDGVEYVLRFGQLKVESDSAQEGDVSSAGGDDADDAPDDPATGADAENAADEGKGENLRRFLFVMARFNQDAVKRPELKELPALPPEKSEPAADEGAQDAAGDEAASDGAAAASEAQSDAEENDADAAEGEQAGATANEAAGDDAQPEDAASAETPTDEDAEAEAVEDDDAGDDESEAKDRDAILAERKSIEEENKRLKDEYDETIKRGQDKVAELNERFGDWYYVISNDVYKQIHLGRSDVIRKKEKKDDASSETTDGAAAAGETDSLSGLPELPGAEAPAAGAAEGGTTNGDAATDDAATPVQGAAADEPAADGGAGAADGAAADESAAGDETAANESE